MILSLWLGVRVEGLEPPCREAPDPKSGVSTNFTTPAFYIYCKRGLQRYSFLSKKQIFISQQIMALIQPPVAGKIPSYTFCPDP